MTDDKVEDFIDVDKFNEEVKKISNEKVFEKPVKEYGIESYRKVIDKLFDNIPVPPEIKNGVINGMFEMLKASKILEHISPEEFERMITSVLLPHKRANNPDFLAGMFGGPQVSNDTGIFGGGMPFEIKQPLPPQMGKLLGSMLGGGGETSSPTMKLSGKVGESYISIEITDAFTCDLALDVLDRLYDTFPPSTTEEDDADNTTG